MDAINIGNWVRAAAAKSGGVPRFAEKIGVPATTIYGWIKGPTEPKASQIAAILKISGDSSESLFGKMHEFSEGPPPYALPAILPPEMAYVPVLDVQPSAGPGALVEAEPVTGVIAMRRDFLRSLGVSAPGSLRVLEARGNSMQPTINAGEYLLVDAGITSVEDEGVYVLVWNGMLVVKRISIGRDAIALVSDRDDAREIIPHADLPGLHVAGRVVRVIKAV